MRANNYGRIINLSSVVAQSGVMGTSAYAASKAGLNGMIKSIALENAQKNITINNITTSDLTDEQSPKEGVFALQLHTGDGEVLFKDIAIEGKPLPTATASLSPSPLVGEGRGEGSERRALAD